jgi:hypothetical protein
MASAGDSACNYHNTRLVADDQPRVAAISAQAPRKTAAAMRSTAVDTENSVSTFIRKFSTFTRKI